MAPEVNCSACSKACELDVPFCTSCGAAIPPVSTPAELTPLKEPLKADKHRFKGLPSELHAFFISVTQTEKAYERRMYRWVVVGLVGLVAGGIAGWRLSAGDGTWLWAVVGCSVLLVLVALIRALAASDFDIPDERLASLIAILEFLETSGKIGEAIELEVDFGDLEWGGGVLVAGERLDGVTLGDRSYERTSTIRQPWLRLAATLNSGLTVLFGAVGWLEQDEKWDRKTRKQHRRKRTHEVIEVRLETDRHAENNEGLREAISQYFGYDLATVRTVTSAPGNFTAVFATPISEILRTVKKRSESPDTVEEVVVSEGRLVDGTTVARILDSLRFAIKRLGARLE